MRLFLLRCPKSKIITQNNIYLLKSDLIQDVVFALHEKSKFPIL